MGATTLSQRVAGFIAEHPGGPCGNCGTSWEVCTTGVLERGSACCGSCRSVDTHGANEAEDALERARRAPKVVTVSAKTLDALAELLRDGDDTDVQNVAGALRGLAAQAVEPR